ncbi:LCP family protein [Kitasatospora sp. NPDC054939]
MAEDDRAHSPTDEPPTGGPPTDGAAADGPPAGGGPPRRTRRRRRRWLLITAGAVAFLLLAGGVLLYAAYRKLDGNIRTDDTTDRLLAQLEADRPSRTAAARGAENILLIGSDDRTGANAAYGEVGGRRSDTTILLHLAAGRRRATAVSIPRDVMVTVPVCERPDGTRTAPRLMQFNAAFEAGGPSCAIRTVEQLSGIRIDHYVIVDFTGFKTMVDAVGGVEVCVPKAIHDKDARLDLPAGRQTLDGEQALGYVRARESLGDGSDTQRMGRQQQFLAALVRKVQSQGVLFNPTKLWPLLDAATSAVQADAGLSSLGELYDLTQELRGIPPQDVALLTAPRRPYRYDSDRDEFVQPQTDALFTALREDRPVTVRPAASGAAGAAAGDLSATARATASATPPATPSAAPSAGAKPSAGAGASASVPPVFEGRTADSDGCTAR